MPRRKYPNLQKTIEQAHATVHALWDKGHITQNNQHIVRAPEEHQAGPGLIAHAHHCKTRNLVIGDHNWHGIIRKILYYPKVEDAKKIATSAGKGHVIAGNPGHTFPGAVGFLLGDVDPRNNSAEINELRGCYNRARTRRTITRSISFRYQKWREHLLRHFFKSMEGHNIMTVEFHVITRRKNENAQQFVEVAKEFGFYISKGKSTARKIVVEKKGRLQK